MTREEYRTYSAWFEEVNALEADGYVREPPCHFHYGYEFGRTIYLRHKSKNRLASVFADFLQNVVEVSINGKLKKTVETCPSPSNDASI